MKDFENSQDWLVIDLGGSIVAPADCEGPDAAFAAEILQFLHRWLLEDQRRHLGLVIGGGAPSRRYQRAAADVRQLLQQKVELAEVNSEALDWLGIRATQLNAEYVQLLVSSLIGPDGKTLLQPGLGVLHQYGELPEAAELGRIVIGGGWKPGFSTDYDAVVLAEHVGTTRLLCLSNIAQIYDDDPRLNPAAQPLAQLDWPSYQQMVGSEWQPGSSMPFDPVATTYAARIGLELIFADGRDLANLECILSGKEFIGTVVR